MMLRLHCIPPRVTKVTVKKAIAHAKNLCFNYEKTPECRAAWELVDELSEVLDKKEEELLDKRISRRMYDV